MISEQFIQERQFVRNRLSLGIQDQLNGSLKMQTNYDVGILEFHGFCALEGLNFQRYIDCIRKMDR